MRPCLRPTVWNCLPLKRGALYGVCPYLSPTVTNESVENVFVSLQSGGERHLVRRAAQENGQARASSPVRAVHEHCIVQAGLVPHLGLPHRLWCPLSPLSLSTGVGPDAKKKIHTDAKYIFV